MQTIDTALEKLQRSKFRSSFRLTAAEKAYVEAKGEETVRRHAEDFVKSKLAAAFPENDGRQTPTRGHPVFKAMHATACCCRGCLNKWYRVEKGVPLSEEAQKKIVALLMAWIRRQIADRDAPEGAQTKKETV